MCWRHFLLLPSAFWLYFHGWPVCVFLRVFSACRSNEKGNPTQRMEKGGKKELAQKFFFLSAVWKKPHNNHTLAKVCMSAGDNLDRCPWTFSPSQFLMPISFSFSPFLFSLSSLWKMHLRFSWHSDNKRAAWAAGKSCAWWWVGDKEVATVSEITDTSGTSSRYLLISDE